MTHIARIARSAHSALHRTLLLSLLIATAACAVDPASGPELKTAAAGPTLWRQIEAEVGLAACDGPQQCHSIAIGAKACGGPDSYLAWSSKKTDATKLRGLVEQYAAARKAENLAAQMMSDCRLITDPGARCQAGRCLLNPASSGAGSALAQ